MTQFKRYLLLLVVSMIACGSAWAYDENNPHEYTKHTGSEDHVLVWYLNGENAWTDMVISPSHPTIQTMVCYKDEEGYDSWLNNDEFSVRVNGKEVVKMKKKQAETPFNILDGAFRGVIKTSDMGHKGNDRYFSQVDITFKYVPLSITNFAVGFYGNYNHNRDGWHWCGRSYDAYVGFNTNINAWGLMKDMISMDTNKGAAPHKGLITLNDEVGWTYPHGVQLFDPSFMPNQTAWATDDQIKNGQDVCLDVTDGRKAYDFAYKVDDDYTPKTFQVRYYVKGEGDSYFFDDIKGNFQTPHYQKATNVNVQFNQWNKKCTLSWNAACFDDNAGRDGHWMVLRSTDGTHFSFIGAADAATMTYTDVSCSNQPYGTSFTYKVTFVPSEWGTPNASNWEQLLSNELMATAKATMSRHFLISNLQADGNSEQAAFTLTWLSDPIELAGTPAFHLWRKDSFANRWEEITTKDSKRNCTEWSVTDRLDISAARAYSYYVSIELMDTTFTSEVITHQRLDKADGVAVLTASKGAYSGSVRLNWTARQSGSDAVTYTLMRRPAGMEGKEPQAWTRLHTTRGTDTYYNYTDQSLSNGVFYEYKVISEAKAYLDNGNTIDSISSTNFGFASLTGVISGQLTYGNGTAVAGARVSIQRKADEEASATYNHSIRCEGGGINWTPSKEATDDWFRGRDWTIQLFVRPDQQEALSTATLLKAGSMAVHLIKAGQTANLDVNGQVLNGLSLPFNEWSCVTITCTRKKAVTVSVIGFDGQPHTASLTSALSADPFATSSSIVIGGGTGSGFYGYIDDVRIFGARALTADETLTLCDRRLAGNERDLVAYWPLDEGITNQQEAYDYSTNAGAANENHGILLPGTRISNVVPPTNMLDFYAITDADGNYIIRGIPYAGTGTNYTVIPTLSTHTFSPASQDRFVNASALVYSGTDFTDVSSFPVTVHVTYDGTTYPVDDVSVSIDGTPVGKDGQLLTTGIDGTVIVDVPIGSHYLTVSRNGHTFAVDGRYPEKGTHTFTSKADLFFYDTTTATFAGRIVGGTNNSDQPLGFAQSTNLIGQARISLQVTREGVGINNDNATGQPLTTPRTFGVPQQNWLPTCSAVSSTANTIDILTDVLSGEFAVALPPIHYTVQSVQIVGDNEGTIRFSDIPPIDLSDVTRTTTDSLAIGGGMQHFEYIRSLVLAHRSAPIVEITPKGQSWFGEQTVTKYDANSDTYYEISCFDPEAPEGTDPYVFGCPIYRQLGTYRMKVKTFERYHNFDTGVDKDDPLTTATVRIDNALSDSCWVSADEGLMAILASNTIRLDSLGEAEYRFRAGIPNITEAEGFRLPITVYCRVDDETILMNDIPHMEGIILGCLPIPGSDFVTAGPEFVNMVLRDPPGNNSYATWRKGSTVSMTIEKDSTYNNTDIIVGHASLLPSFQYESGVPGWSVVTTICPQLIIDANASTAIVTESNTGYTESVTTSEDISTSNDANWDGPDADVFIGTSTNRLFCQSHVVDLRRDVDGKWRISLKDELSDGLQFTTDFRFTAWEIKNQQIPKLREFRDALILEPQEWSEGNTNNTDHLLYWSPVLTSADEGFGEPGNYKIIQPVDASTPLVLTDSVSWYNTSITNWKNRLLENEREKVLAFAHRDKLLARNVSISDGVSDAYTIRYDTLNWTKTTNDTLDTDEMIVSGGLVVCNFGDVEGGGYHSETRYTSSEAIDTVKYNEFSYELLTKGYGNALTIDIFDPSKADSTVDKLFTHTNFSPIFRTRGGSTSGFHEPEYRAEFYEPEKHHLIMEGTVQTHVPELTATNGIYQYTGIPAESTAKILLTMKNLSGTGINGYYTLYLDSGSNPEGASYTVDGTPLEQGVTYYFTYGQPLYATVECRQVNPDILEYNPVFYLADPDQPEWTGVHEAIADSTVREKAIHIEFARVSSAIDLTCESTRVNASTPGCRIPVTLSGFNTQSTRLRTISLEYYNTALDSWTTLQAWTRDPEADPSLTPIDRDVASLTTEIDFTDAPFLTDRTYRFRAATTSWFGNEKATTYSDEITIVKDMEAPHTMAFSPADGIMHAGTEVSVTFNEDIDESINAANVHLRGVLASQPVVHEVSLNTNTAKLRTLSAVNIPEGTGTITLWVKRMRSLAANVPLLTLEGEDNLDIHVLDGKLVASFGNCDLVSGQPLPDLGVWTYLVLAFERDAETGLTTFSAGYATDDSSATLIAPQVLPENVGIHSGNLNLGPYCRFHDVCVWDDYRPLNELQSNAFTQKKASTPHLVAHWPMDVQQGRTAEDQIGGNHIALSNEADWAIERVNYAVTTDNDVSYQIPIYSAATTDGEDYHIQFWYRFDYTTPGSTILTFGDSRNRHITIQTDNLTGEPVLVWNGGKSTLGTIDDLDEGSWYRFDFVTQKSLDKGAIVYLNGKPSSLVPLAATPNLEGLLTIGGQGSSVSIDEFRVWHRALDAETMEKSMYASLNTGLTDVCLYYPFEEVTSRNGSEKTYGFSLHDLVNPTSGCDVRVVGAKEPIVESINVPPVKGVPELSGVSFTLTRSERRFILNIDEPQQNIEGCTLYAQIQGLKDKAGNVVADDVTWSFYVSLDNLRWNDASLALCSSETDEQTILREGLCTRTVSFVNNSPVSQGWYITGLPSWLEASVQSGNLKAGEQQTITFRANGSTLTGTHEGKLYLTEAETGISHSLPYTMSYLPNLPDWHVDRTDIPNTMNLIGQVTLANVIQTNANSLLAAFDRHDRCAGVAAVEPVDDYGSNFVQMTLYGSAAETDSLTFRYYDANTGTLYPVMMSTRGGQPLVIRFTPDDVIGSFTQPVIFSTTSLIRQTISRDGEGWDYFSFYVEPADDAVTAFLDAASLVPDEGLSLRIVHNDGFALYEDGLWLTDGTFTHFTPGTAYKLWTSAPFATNYVGPRADAPAYPITLVPGWNWLGVLLPSRTPLAQALSRAGSLEDDFVKDYHASAICEHVGSTARWQGKLTALTPGQGYLYRYGGTEPTTFTYPDVTYVGLGHPDDNTDGNAAARRLANANAPSLYYGNVDVHASSGVMPVVAQVLLDGIPVTDCEVAAFNADDQLCGEARPAEGSTQGLILLLLHGDGEQAMHLQVILPIDGQPLVVPVETTLPYADGTLLGTAAQPYTLHLTHQQIGELTHLRSVTGDAVDLPRYDTSGRRILQPAPNTITVTSQGKRLEKSPQAH